MKINEIFVQSLIETLKLWIFGGTVFMCIFLPPILVIKGYFYSGGILFLLEAFCATYYSVYLDLKRKDY